MDKPSIIDIKFFNIPVHENREVSTEPKGSGMPSAA